MLENFANAVKDPGFTDEQIGLLFSLLNYSDWMEALTLLESQRPELEKWISYTIQVMSCPE